MNIKLINALISLGIWCAGIYLAHKNGLSYGAICSICLISYGYVLDGEVRIARKYKL